MASSWTYTTLKQAIKDHCEDQSTDFAAQLDMLIGLGEDMILKDLPLAIFDARANVTIAAGLQTASKPAGAIATLDLYYTNASVRTVLKPRTYSYCIEFAPNTTQATPKYFADDYSETQYWLAPNPNVSVTAEALHTKRPASIVTATTTYIGTNVGDLLLDACMIVAERLALADEKAKWEADYARDLKAARIDLRHLLRRSYATLSPMPQAVGKGER